MNSVLECDSDCTRNSIAFVMRKLLYASHGNAFSAVGVVDEAEDSTINTTSKSFLHRGKRKKGTQVCGRLKDTTKSRSRLNFGE